MITCKQAVDYISKKEEGKLSPAKRFELWQHFAVCSLCRLFYKQNKFITGLLRKPSDNILRISDEEKERITEEVLNSEKN